MANNNDDPPPTPIAPLDEQAIDPTDVMEYYAYNAADRLEYVKGQIEEREKAHFNLYLISISLNGNPEPGPHREVNPDEVQVCMCGACELSRVTKLLLSMVYAISKLKALHSSLT